jgi:endonuclease-3
VNPAKRAEIYSRLAAHNPHPRTELDYRNPFELLVAVILSAQATDVSVNKATAELFAVANTPAALLELGEDGLKRYIRTIGLFNSKAKHIIAACRILVERHDGRVPDERAALEARTGLAPGKTVLEVEQRLLKFTLDKYRQDAHHWLILHGRYVCKARQPLCGECIIADLCEYRHKTKPATN